MDLLKKSMPEKCHLDGIFGAIYSYFHPLLLQEGNNIAPVEHFQRQKLYATHTQEQDV